VSSCTSISDMSGYRKQIRVYGLAILTYTALNAFVWYLFTHQFFDPTYYVGDLARISYLSQYAQPRQVSNTLPRRHITYPSWDGEPIDIVTLGDSFSSGGGGGENNYYQDWLATHHDLNVMALPRLSSGLSNIETVHLLLNSGFLDVLAPKAILLEDIGREVVKKHGRKINTGLKWPIAKIEEVFASEQKSRIPTYQFLNSGNLKFLINQALYLLDDNALASQVYRTELKQPFFSGVSGTTLLFHVEDFENAVLVQAPAVGFVVRNLNDLTQRLSSRDIELYYMPAVDKLDLYQDQIQESVYPENKLFEILRTYPRSFNLVDTKAILRPAVEAGEKDIYYRDDTHWTWKACERIAQAFSIVTSPNR
jgi:hypothetical protein